MQLIKVKKAPILLFLFAIFVPGFGNPEKSIIHLIGKEMYVELKDKHEVSVIIRKNENLKLLPSVSTKEVILKRITEMNPSIGVEFLTLIKTNHQDIPGNSSTMLKIYNKLVSIGTLKGILYYSESRKKKAVLYSKAHIIDSPEKKKPVKDPVFNSIPNQNNLYTFFKDSSLGEYFCMIKYLYIDNLFIMEMENITAIHYLFLPIVQPEGLLSYIIILPGEEEILFYGFSCLKIADFLGTREGKINSLYNRIKAFYEWFFDFVEFQL